MRKAFSLITAIFVIVIMASVAAFVLNLSGKIVKSTSAQYQHEQAELYAKSYTEYAILAITGHKIDSSKHCLENINATIKLDPSSSVSVTNGNGYQIRTRIAYIGSSSLVNNCSSSTRKLSNNVHTAETPLTVVIDAYVDYKDPDHAGSGTPWITVHRRSVQKI